MEFWGSGVQDFGVFGFRVLGFGIRSRTLGCSRFGVLRFRVLGFWSFWVLRCENSAWKRTG